MTEPIQRLIETHATRHPDKAALIFKRGAAWETITFGQLFQRSHLLARGLASLRLQAGSRVALMSPPSPDFFALCFALLKLNLVPVLVDPAIGLRNVTDCLNESQPEIFIGNALTHFIRRVYKWGKDSIRVNTTIPQLLRDTQHAPLITDHRLLITDAAIIYTSGSTGLPKGAIFSRENFSAQLDMLRATFNIHEHEIDLPAFPLFALIDILLGVTSVIPDMRFPAPASVNPAKVTEAIRRFSVTNMFASPILLDHVADYALARGLNLPSLKRIISAGAPAPVSVLERAAQLLPHASIFGIYGATESLPITVIDSREILDETRHLSARGAGVCIGKPVDGARVRIIQITDEPISQWDASLELPANQVGEITVKGGAVTKAYVARHEANRLAKIDDHGETVHRMGDLGYFDERGRLWFCGRKSHRVETRHGTMFTEQIEGIFNAHPSVYRAALVGVDGEPVLWVELEANARHADKEQIKSELIDLAKNHSQASQVKIILFAKKFPTDVRHNSKIIRETLTKRAESQIPKG
ncbi:MAG: Long-chain-fatty-acid--CoA ligase [Anaerolineales bacterium]|nr:Long-chain-fatty-acid--CoA ligase [Anaerolineales bacterium]